ncbi:MAG: FkbM family methyltransferase [Actinomycetota bacterium]
MGRSQHDDRPHRAELDSRAASPAAQRSRRVRAAHHEHTACVVRAVQPWVRLLGCRCQHGSVLADRRPDVRADRCPRVRADSDDSTHGRKIVRANDADVEVFEVAASDTAGRAALHLADHTDVSNSLVDGFKASSRSVDVELLTLDDHSRDRRSSPSVIKIDVEGHESAVLGGAQQVIARDRPHIIIEVLNRRGHDFGRTVEDAMNGHGYSYYQLGPSPTWEAASRIAGIAGAVDNDWLLSPVPLQSDFVAAVEIWRQRVATCTAAHNPRVPIVATTIAALRRGGVSEVVGSARRWRASARRGRSRAPTPSARGR